MRRLLITVAVLVLCSSALGISLPVKDKMSQSIQPSKKIDELPPYSFDAYECPKKVIQNCTGENWYRGCVCYKNETCDTTWLNRCESCKNPNVVSVHAGEKCPNQTSDENECFATMPFLIIDCFFPTTSPGCKCFTNGTCIDTDVDNCRDCQARPVETIATNQNCKGQKYKYFVPKVCNISAANVRCSSKKVSGCLCYKNGSCIYTSKFNSCRACIRDDVASFNPNERCPANATNYQICPANRTSVPDTCDGNDLTLGCYCTKSQSCVYTRYSPCYACQDENVIFTIPNGKCPLKKNIYGKQVFEN